MSDQCNYSQAFSNDAIVSQIEAAVTAEDIIEQMDAVLEDD